MGSNARPASIIGRSRLDPVISARGAWKQINMQDLNLRYLYEAAKLGSMRAAADNLGVAVSSVSRQISQLEADMGIGLIEHGRRTIKLTEAGLLLIEHYSEQLRVNEAFDAR